MSISSIDAFSGSDLPVNVAISNQNPYCIKINVTNLAGSIGDIRGIFFNLGGSGYDNSSLGSVTITILSWIENDGTTTNVFVPNVDYKYQCSTTSVFPLLSSDAQMNGGGSGGDGGRIYNCGIEVRNSFVVTIDFFLCSLI
jgi:hypothetical protein